MRVHRAFNLKALPSVFCYVRIQCFSSPEDRNNKASGQKSRVAFSRPENLLAL
jgi:hypothetical protein